MKKALIEIKVYEQPPAGASIAVFLDGVQKTSVDIKDSTDIYAYPAIYLIQNTIKNILVNLK